MIETAIAAAASLVSGATVQWHCDRYGRSQRIYFANHSSHLDFIIIWSALSAGARAVTRPVAGRDYWERGAVRRYVASRIFRAVLIQRSNGRVDEARMATERMATAMGDRDSLIVFPEGTRSLDGRVAPFKSGLFHLTRLRPDAELIPVFLENLNRILPKGEVLPVPMLSRLVFGVPLQTISDEDKEPFLARARDALIQLRSCHDAPGR